MVALSNGRCYVNLNVSFAETHSEVELLRQCISKLESDNELLRLEKRAAIDFLEKDGEKIKRLEAEVARLQKEKEEFYERLASGRIPGWVLEWFVHVSSSDPVP